MNININKNNVKKGFVPYVFLLLALLAIYYCFNILNREVHMLGYNDFVVELDKNNVKEVVVTPRSRAGVYEITGKLESYDKNESFFIRVPLTDSVIEEVLKYNEDDNFKFDTVNDPESSSLLLIVVNVLPIVIMVAGVFFILSRQMGGANKSMDFGRSRAKLVSDENEITFKDVAGLKEEKEEVKELIDFLKMPKKFQKLGARIPKGVLLVGPPGTGKTLLAKAVAGEAHVPFYYISGSDFVELFVGGCKVRCLSRCDIGITCSTWCNL